MESPLSKVSRDMERLNQSLARMKAVDSVSSTAAEKSIVTTSNESLTMKQSNILLQPNNQILSSLESSFSSPIPYSTRLRFDEDESLPLPQSKGNIPQNFQLNTNNSTSPSNLSASEELMQARILAESASVRVSAAEALCADLGRRILMVEQQSERFSSPERVEYNSNGQLKSLASHNEYPMNGLLNSDREHIHSNSSLSLTSSFAYPTARPESLNGSVTSPLQPKLTPRSRLRLRANKDTVLAQARARESILYGKSWGKPLETSRAEIESPPQADSSSEDDDEDEEEHELTKLSQEKHDVDVKDEENATEKTKVFPTQAFLSQSMMVNDERNLSQRLSSRNQSPTRTHMTIPSLPQTSVVALELYKDVINNEIYLETEKSSITKSLTQNHGLPIISSKFSSASMTATPSETAFEARLTKLEANVQTPHMTENNVSSHFKDANVQTEETLKDKHISRDKDETTESTTAVALELHAEMSEATALEMALLHEKLRETNETLLLLQQEVVNLPSRGVSPLSNESGENADEVEIEGRSASNKAESHPQIFNASKLSSSRSSAQTAASALLRCAELEGKLNAAKLEGQVKEQRWISSVQAAQLGVVVKAVQDCVFAIAPKSENAPTPLPLPLRRVHHEQPQGPKRVGIETGPISRSNVAFRQAYWPNERALFQRPCWSKDGMSTQNSRPSTHSSLYNYNREVNESAERNMKDVINKLRNTLATCAAVVDTNNVAGSFYTT
jgi:hypothetical protein